MAPSGGGREETQLIVETIIPTQANQISLKSNFEGTLVLMFLLMSAFTEQKMEQMMHHKSTLS